jgi:glycosyltransferase involved in cell wall biosynthesis
MLFVGSYGYAPNVDAAEFLLREVFPRVYAALPATRLLLVGNSIESLPSHASGAPGVEFTGFVENLSEIYAQAAVVCCPIRYGGGTRIKIIEAAAHGAAIVSTSIGAEGLDFIPGAEILIRDKSDEFADACIKLLLDPRAAREMGIKARSKARRYDRARVLEEIARMYESSAYVE